MTRAEDGLVQVAYGGCSLLGRCPSARPPHRSTPTATEARQWNHEGFPKYEHRSKRKNNQEIVMVSMS
jgi:hypothetical protein